MPPALKPSPSSGSRDFRPGCKRRPSLSTRGDARSAVGASPSVQTDRHLSDGSSMGLKHQPGSPVRPVSGAAGRVQTGSIGTGAELRPKLPHPSTAFSGAQLRPRARAAFEPSHGAFADQLPLELGQCCEDAVVDLSGADAPSLAGTRVAARCGSGRGRGRADERTDDDQGGKDGGALVSGEASGLAAAALGASAASVRRNPSSARRVSGPIGTAVRASRAERVTVAW